MLGQHATHRRVEIRVQQAAVDDAEAGRGVEQVLVVGAPVVIQGGSRGTIGLRLEVAAPVGVCSCRWGPGGWWLRKNGAWNGHPTA